VREIARVGGRPKVVSQIYIGSPKKVAALVSGQSRQDGVLKVEEFGSLWVAQQMDADFDLAGIIDAVIPRGKNEKGPSVGEYFLYCVWNRMVDAVSKNKLALWYSRTAVQHIRPVDIKALTSQQYWEKWDRVNHDQLQAISRRFFERRWQMDTPDADCFLFDTTNYYTFMSSSTQSDLACRGKNKQGRHHLRQVGLGLLVARNSKLPLYYTVYPGNLHDSRLFEQVMDEMFAVVCGLHKTKQRLTVVIDKGMNSDGNYAWIDEHARIHFVTSYSTYFARELAARPLDIFEPVDTAKNRKLVKQGQPEERLLAFRTSGQYWGKQRAVVVTYNPATARKKSYTLDSKLETLRQELIVMRAKVQKRAPHWRNPKTIKERYLRLCERMHLSSDLFVIDLKKSEGLKMGFRKDVYRVERKKAMFGKNIIITDNTDWTTTEIIAASLDRWQVEDRFRLSKDDDLVGVQPIRHWTDSKIRCHLFTCIIAMVYLRRLELKLMAAGVNRTAEDVIDDMRHLHSVLTLPTGHRKPRRQLEHPTKTQAEVLSALGHHVTKGGVLQPLRR
jgi:transposase